MASMTRPKPTDWIDGYKRTLLEGWLRDGLSNEQISKNIGIDDSTLYRWMKKCPELCDIIKKTKEVSISEVENSLFKSANGFTYDEVTYYRDPDTGQMIEAKRVTKMMKPDVTAQIFIMKTRKPENYGQHSALQTTEDKISTFIDTIESDLDDTAEENSDGTT